MRIYLRPVTLEDEDLIIKWRNAPEVSNVCFDKTPVTIEKNKEYFRTNIETGKYKQFIVERIDEDFGVSSCPIATVYLKNIDSMNNRCQLCIFKCDEQEWNTESQSIAISILLQKAFKEYNMNKVYTYVFAGNIGEVDLMRKSGFVEEAILEKEAKGITGEYVDVYRMRVLKEEYIKRNYKSHCGLPE